MPNLERRYARPSPPPVREELAKYLGMQPCPDCRGTRLNRAARYVFVGGRTACPKIAHLTVGRALEFVRRARTSPAGAAKSPTKIVKDVAERLRFLVDVGLDYLTLDRSAESLSGGEAQRIRLASQVGSGLTGVMYILDEPSIGLHQRDNQRLLATLKHLRDLGNTVIVVEHDEEAIRAADHVLDIGPGRGRARRRARGAGHADGNRGQRRVDHRPVPVRADEDRAAGTAHTARSGEAAVTGRRRERQQPARTSTRRVPARAVHLRHRRLRLGQVHAGQRHAVHTRQPSMLNGTVHGSGAVRARRGPASRSTASSTSTRAPSAARRARIRPPTPGLFAPAARAVRRRAGGARARLRRRAASAST